MTYHDYAIPTTKGFGYTSIYFHILPYTSIYFHTNSPLLMTMLQIHLPGRKSSECLSRDWDGAVAPNSRPFGFQHRCCQLSMQKISVSMPCSLIDSCDRSLEKQPYCWLDGEPGQLARWGNSHGEGLKFCGRGQVGRFATSDSGTGSRVAARTSCSDLQKDHVCVFVTSMADKTYPSKWWNHRNLDWTCHWIKVELACNSSLQEIRYHHAASLWTCAGHRSSSISWRSAHRFWAVEMVRPLSCPMPFFHLFF